VLDHEPESEDVDSEPPDRCLTVGVFQCTRFASAPRPLTPPTLLGFSRPFPLRRGLRQLEVNFRSTCVGREDLLRGVCMFARPRSHREKHAPKHRHSDSLDVFSRHRRPILQYPRFHPVLPLVFSLLDLARSMEHLHSHIVVASKLRFSCCCGFYPPDLPPASPHIIHSLYSLFGGFSGRAKLLSLGFLYLLPPSF